MSDIPNTGITAPALKRAAIVPVVAGSVSATMVALLGVAIDHSQASVHELLGDVITASAGLLAVQSVSLASIRFAPTSPARASILISVMLVVMAMTGAMLLRLLATGDAATASTPSGWLGIAAVSGMLAAWLAAIAAWVNALLRMSG